jgi:transcriptional regulator with XRE-family HTH domain
MSQEALFINGELLRLRREARGWVLNDMATRACMSVKQIRQLEEGGTSSFYSEAVKVTAAKKVGALLGLSADEVFAQDSVSESIELEAPLVTEVDSVLEEPIEQPAVVESSVATACASNELHIQTPTVEVTASSTSEQIKSKTSLWVIASLFVAALAVAAYLQPKDEPAAEPAPPLQVLPSDASDSASAASAADGASAADSSQTSPASSSLMPQKPASAIAAPVSVPGASAIRQVASMPANVSSSASRPASSVVPTPPLSSASKTP